MVVIAYQCLILGYLSLSVLSSICVFCFCLFCLFVFFLHVWRFKLFLEKIKSQLALIINQPKQEGLDAAHAKILF